MNLCINWIDAQGEYNQEIWNLANNTVYGFNPTNSESRVTFYDVINTVNGEAVATFGTGDTIYIRSKDDAGLVLEDVGMSLVYDFFTWGEMIGMMMVFDVLMHASKQIQMMMV